MAHIGLVKPWEKRPPSQYADSVGLGNKKSFFGLFSMYEVAVCYHTPSECVAPSNENLDVAR